MQDLRAFIREVPDFPKPGVRFYDITTLMQSPEGFEATLSAMQSFLDTKKPDKLVGIESRGFLFAAPLAHTMQLPLLLARKPGKLPYRTIAQAYELEYGTDAIEIHADTIGPGDRVAIVDDLIATGGTVAAVAQLVEKLGGEVVGISAVVALEFLPYRERLKGHDLDFLVSYDSE